MSRWLRLCALLPTCMLVLTRATFHPRYEADGTASEVIVDVAVVGGGASGAYAATRLKDLGLSVCLIEERDTLGGHSQTYTDSATQVPIEYGVVFFHDDVVTRRYMNRYGIEPYKNSITDPDQHRIEFYDLQTGQHADFQPPEFEAVRAALERYDHLLTTHYSYLDEGYNLPQPVPEELLLPFLDFVKKYDLDDMLNIAFQMGQGYGDLLKAPTLYAMKILSHGLLQQVAQGSLLRMANNSELYSRVQSDLESNALVLLGSRAVQIKRPSGQNELTTLLVEKKMTGARTRLKARQVLLSVPPVLEPLQKFLDLDSLETSLFSQFECNYYWAGVLRNAPLPDYEVQNVNLNNPGAVPTLPGMYVFEATEAPNIHTFWYGADTQTSNQTEQRVREDVVNTIRALRLANGDEVGDIDGVEFLAIEDFSPFACMVNSTAIRQGFYRDLYQLQGRRNTWWTGAAWHTHDSSKLWEFTESLLPSIVAALVEEDGTASFKQDL